MSRLGSFILDILYPRFCFGCGFPGEFLCDRCYSRLDFSLETDLIPRLFAPSQPHYLTRVQAVVNYDTLLQKMLHHYKYLGCRDLAATFAFWLWQFLDCGEIDIVTYIPIHRRRRRQRGYNQAELIAREYARLAGLPCYQLLVRPVYKTNQARSRSKAERQQKTQDIFALGPDAAKLAPSSKILIIDDVVTTGSTLNEAARVLHEAHFQHLQAAAIAHGDN